MRTIGKRLPSKRPRGDFRARCFECRAPDYRSKLVRGADGNLRHPEHDGPTALELSQRNAARAVRRPIPPIDGGRQ